MSHRDFPIELSDPPSSGGGGAPSGPAGGDLTGNYPNPTVGAGAIGDNEIAPGANIDPDKIGTYLPIPPGELLLNGGANPGLAYTCDPGAVAAGGAPTAGIIHLCRFEVPKGLTLNGASIVVTSLGATLANSFLALITSDGTRQRVTADQSAAWSSGGTVEKAAAWTGGAYNLAGGDGVFAWLALLIGSAVTMPNIGRLTGPANMVNLGLDVAHCRAGSSGAGLTAIPASIVPANNALQQLTFAAVLW